MVIAMVNNIKYFPPEIALFILTGSNLSVCLKALAGGRLSA